MACVVNGEFVETQRFFDAFRRLGGFEVDEASNDDTHEAETLQHRAERQVITQVLLRQMALKEGFSVSTSEMSEQRTRRWGTSSASVCGVALQRELTDNLLVEKYCHWLARHEPRPSRVEVEQHYARHRAEFWLPERVKAAHIVCNVELPSDEKRALAKIEQAEQELARGAAFAKVADRYSDCGRNGILGWVARGETVPEFENVIFALPESERSGSFRTVFGFHIATVLQRKPAGFQSLEELRPMLARRLFEARRNRVIEDATEQMFRSATIEAVPESRAIA